MSRRIISSPRSESRIRETTTWLADRPRAEPVIVIGATTEAANECARRVALQRGSAFGVRCFTLARFAAEHAKLELVERNLVPIGTLAIEALCARVVHDLRVQNRLGRLEAVANQPGLPRALARTLDELRLAGIVPEAPELAWAVEALDAALAAARLADRALVYAIAAERASNTEPIVFVDVAIRNRAEQRLLAKLVDAAPDVLATVPAGDRRTLASFETALGVTAETILDPGTSSLHRVQRDLFAPEANAAALDDTIVIFSAPGESRECVEIARHVLRAAESGVPFDRMAVLLRAPEQYRAHLEEGFARAGIPTYFERGTILPDPSGRAFLALLACAVNRLSARRFAEYVSLGEVPDDDNGAPPHPSAPGDRWVPPEEELLPSALARALDDELAVDPVVPGGGAAPGGTLRAPWRWERLLVEAAVIGGRDRWQRRLDGLEASLRLGDHDDNRARRLADLEHLRRFALPLLDELAALPERATWGDWLTRLSALATRALRRPDRVLAVLAALVPMTEVGPVELREVELVLHARLTELAVRPTGRRYGKVLVAPIDSVRGLAFDVVFAPGLAERMFPKKIAEDPLLIDNVRRVLGIETRDDRLDDERLALRLAVGAATTRVVWSYPRIDLDQGRPRVPSFYGLEVLEAAEGALPGFDDLGKRADVTGAARIGWPAPADSALAIDEAEHDLAVLDGLLRGHAPMGAAHYLLGANPHLARALRSRARRWEIKAWKPADGFIVTTDEARTALAAHAPTARSFSPTALEQLAACPLRFVFRTILRLEPREVPEPVESLGPLERGSLVHEVQFELLGELRDAGALPVRAATLDAARDRLDIVLDRVAAKYRDELFPAIERVWNDGIASIRADLREWLRRLAGEIDWTPHRFELAFGLDDEAGRDPASVTEPVRIDAGLALRGSIDLVELRGDGALRATDHKTGKVRVDAGSVISGGRSLQPVLYALVLEKMFPGVVVAGGRLDYGTTRGDFQSVTVALDDEARAAAAVLAETLAHHLHDGFFPAAPDEGECRYCDFRPLCGPYEEQRSRNKDRSKLVQLTKLRETR